MDRYSFPWGLYMPGITLIGIGVLVLILPEFLVLLVASLLFISGTIALFWARQIHRGLKSGPSEIEWSIFRRPW